MVSRGAHLEKYVHLRGHRRTNGGGDCDKFDHVGEEEGEEEEDEEQED